MAEPLRFHPDVAGDIQTAVGWYTEKSVDLANRFRDALNQGFDRIVENPEMHPVAFDDVRFTRLRTFPYLIQFRIRNDLPFVLGVFHGASDPSTWMQRAK